MARALLVGLAMLVSVRPAAAQGRPDPQDPPPAAQERQDRPAAPPEPRPYDRVITKDAKSDEGLFTVHRIKEKVYYEIPKAQLDKELLWVTQIAKTTAGVGYGGQALGNRVVKWERRDNRILLRSVSYDVVADKSQPIARAVQAANNEPILMAFNIEAFGKDDTAVIDATRLLTTEVAEFSARTRLRARGFDASRSYVERVVSFPENIEAEVLHTYTAPPEPPAAGRGAPGPGRGGAVPAGMRGNSATVVLHYSMVKLPERPMMPRAFDERVGYFSVAQTDYGKDEHRSPARRYITRWRLEKKDPAAQLSEPVKPIVYYVDPATPTKWVSYIKRGIEKWQPAFEEAGFKHAILAKEAPKPSEDPDWSPEDARYSVIRWLPSTIENASGPHVHDPRTGEILESDIQFYHNVMNLSRDWYFVQVGPLDPRAKTLPLPDDLMGQLIEYVAAHEVGHTLGFQHNMKASSMYPADKVRDKEWLKKMGHTPTLMDYSRFNYVVQPEDGVRVEDLIPGVGPYDKWATMWGYKPIAGAKTPEDEKKTLDQWVRAQDDTPWLRFSTADSRGADPGELTEAVGDGDAVTSTTMGLKNLERVAGMLLSATTRPGEPYNDLQELYGRMLGQWGLEMVHVTQIVGGVQSRQKHGGQEGVRFVPLPRARQAEAVRFLNERAFVTPSFVIDPDILRRIEVVGIVDRVKTAQQRVLTSLLSVPRLARLIEQEAIDGAKAYAAPDMLGDVRKGVWTELSAAAVKVDPYRRNLQRVYLDLFAERLNGRAPVIDDARAFLRGELRALDAQVRAAQAKAGDAATRLHLADVRDQIAKTLDPKLPMAAPAAGPGGPALSFDEDLEQWLKVDELSCWPDYAIRGK